jgi:uncharacterized protein
MMQLDISLAEKTPGLSHDFEIKEPWQAKELENESIRCVGFLTLKGQYKNIGEDRVEIKGEMSITLELICARCLNKYQYPIKLQFREDFLKDISHDEDAFIYKQDTLELDQMIETLIRLEVPMKPLCKQDCTGGQGIIIQEDTLK